MAQRLLDYLGLLLDHLVSSMVWLGTNIEVVAAVVTTLLAVWIALLSVSRVARWYTRLQLRHARASAVGRVLADLGVSGRERRRWLAAVSRTSSAVDEVGLLLGVLESGSAGAGPFLVQVDGRGLLDVQKASRICAAYEKSVSRLESRVLFATTATTAIYDAAESMRAVVAILQSYIDGGRALPATTHTLGHLTKDCLVRVFDFDGPKDTAATVGNIPRDLAVTYWPQSLRQTENVEESERTPGPREYNGHLPWLTAFRAETDQSNGRPRLHLGFGRVTFNRQEADNDSRLSIDPTKEWPDDGLLTLSVMALDSRGRLLAVRRGQGVAFADGRLNSFVTGNLDLKTRRHLNLDVDAVGLPSPTEAARREVREETGIYVRPERIHAIGLSRLWCTDENAMDLGTYVLTFVAPIDMPVDRIAREFRFADPVEGAWEIGSEMLAISLPGTPKEVANLVRWISLTKDPVGHLPAGILLLAAARGMRLSDIVTLLNSDDAADEPTDCEHLVETHDLPSPLTPS